MSVDSKFNDMILPVRAANFQDDLYFRWKNSKEVEMFENCVEQLYTEDDSEDIKRPERERNGDTKWSKPKTKNKRKKKRDIKCIKHKK